MASNTTAPEIMLVLSSAPKVPAPVPAPGLTDQNILIILFGTIIFVLAIVGNSLVILTLWKHKGMRTVTNVYLLNISITDLLLTFFCLPFTVAGTILRQFVFGPTVCRLLPFLQALSISANMWTLVALSLERFFAINHPLKSKTWQTTSRAFKVNVAIWIISFAVMSPLIYINRLVSFRPSSTSLKSTITTSSPTSITTHQLGTIVQSAAVSSLYILNVSSTLISDSRERVSGNRETTPKIKMACREQWPNRQSAIIFTWFINIFLFIIPLIVMTFAYASLAHCLLVKVSNGYWCAVDRTDSEYVDTPLNGTRESTSYPNLKKSVRSTISPSLRANRASTKSLTSSKLVALMTRPEMYPRPKSNHIYRQRSEETSDQMKEISSRYTKTSVVEANDSRQTTGSEINSTDEDIFGVLYPMLWYNLPDSTLYYRDGLGSASPSVSRRCKPVHGCKHSKSKCSRHGRTSRWFSQNFRKIPFTSKFGITSSYAKSGKLSTTGRSWNRRCDGIMIHQLGYSRAKLLKIVRMLVVIVAEFFVCWTPVYVINTWVIHDPRSFYFGHGHFIARHVYAFHLIAYASCCLNPITYCFMNRRFRLYFVESFKAMFRMRK